MFCPRCGLEAPGSLRFCSRCGLRLDAVAFLLENNGELEKFGVPLKESGMPARRKKMRQGARLMFFSGVLTPIFFALSIIDDSPNPLIIPFTVFLAGLAWMLYFYLFGDSNAEAQDQGKLSRSTAAPLKAIPASQNERVMNPGLRTPATRELAHRPSVTEGTTELFEEK
jgi:hypothetical protein